MALLGAGGMGEVHLARDTRLGRDVAIKFCGEAFTERFEREARAVAALNHPNICTLFDVGPNYLVMEYIEGDVRSFAPTTETTGEGGKFPVSNGGGSEPRWRRDGKELFYLGGDGNVMAVEVTTTPTFRAGVPKPLFPIPAGAAIRDVTDDGQKFLFPVLVAESSRPPFTLMMNWLSALPR